MSIEIFRPWIELSIVLWNCGLTAVLWMRKPGVDAAREVQKLRMDFDLNLKLQADQIIEMRAHMQHMPKTEELIKLEGTLRQLNERANGLAENMTTVRASLHRIEDFLLRHKT